MELMEREIKNTKEMFDLFHDICLSCDASVQEVLEYSEKPYFDYGALSSLSTLKFEDIRRIGFEKNWDWRHISWGDGIQFQDILDNIDLPWNWGFVINNPNLKWDDIIEFNENYPLLSVWNVSGYIQNDMKKEKDDFIETLQRKHMAAFKIQCYFRRAYYFPEYKICRNVINRDYEKTFS